MKETDVATLNRTDIADRLGGRPYTSERVIIDAEMAAAVVAGFLDAVAAAVAAGDTVNLRGFGVFEPRHRRASQHRMPGTDRVIEVGAHNTIGFRPSPSLKRRIEEAGR